MGRHFLLQKQCLPRYCHKEGYFVCVSGNRTLQVRGALCQIVPRGWRKRALYAPTTNCRLCVCLHLTLPPDSKSVVMLMDTSATPFGAFNKHRHCMPYALSPCPVDAKLRSSQASDLALKRLPTCYARNFTGNARCSRELTCRAIHAPTPSAEEADRVLSATVWVANINL